MIAILLLVAFLAGVVIGPLYTAVYVRQQQGQTSARALRGGRGAQLAAPDPGG